MSAMSLKRRPSSRCAHYTVNCSPDGTLALMGIDVSFLAAFLAGVLSISSPCVLPLVPIVLAHLARSSAAVGDGIDHRRVLPSAIA